MLRHVAKYLGTEHHELLVEDVDLLQTLRTLVYHYDEPFGDAAGFPVYLLSRFAREHVKVVLAGDGGDELFGGYRRYAADQLAPFYGRFPSVLTESVIPAIVDHLPRLRRIKRSVKTLPIRIRRGATLPGLFFSHPKCRLSYCVAMCTVQ